MENLIVVRLRKRDCGRKALEYSFASRHLARSESLVLNVVRLGFDIRLPGQACSPLFWRNGSFSQIIFAATAKLFTVGCGDECAALTWPPMNNFGRPIRVRFPSPAPKPLLLL
jgi:hypothetical protein